MPRGNQPLGEIGTEKLFENDRIAISTLVLEPGQSSDWHIHGHDYVTVTVEGGNPTLEEGGRAPQANESGPGSWRFRDFHEEHQVTNKTGTRFRNLIIELKY